MQCLSIRALVAVSACALACILATPGDARAQRSALYYPQSYGPTYGYYVAPSPVYARPGWRPAPYGPRIAPYTVPVDVLPAPHYYGSPYHGRAPGYYYH